MDISGRLHLQYKWFTGEKRNEHLKTTLIEVNEIKTPSAHTQHISESVEGGRLQETESM